MSDYEIHITIDPAFDRVDEVRPLVALRGFKMGNLLMRKSDGPGEPSRDDMFFTGHRDDIEAARSATIALVRALRENDFVVRRYKIEHVLVDSRNGNDTFRILQ